MLIILSAFYLGFIKKNTHLKGIKDSLLVKVKTYNHSVQFLLVFAIIFLAFLAIKSDYNPHYFLIMLISLMIYFLLKNYESLLAISYIAFILLSVFVIGYSIADNESTYQVMKNQSTNQSYVVLNIQGGKAIVAEVDLKKNTIYPEYQLIKFETDKLNEHTLNLKKIENLRVEDLKIMKY